MKLPQLKVAISGRHSVTTRARSSIVMPTPPPLVGWTIASQRSPMPASTSRNRPRSAAGLPVSGSRTCTCTIAAPALEAPAAESTICSGVTGIAGLWPGTLIPPVRAQDRNTGSRLTGPPRRLEPLALERAQAGGESGSTEATKPAATATSTHRLAENEPVASRTAPSRIGPTAVMV